MQKIMKKILWKILNDAFEWTGDEEGNKERSWKNVTYRKKLLNRIKL